MACWVRVPCSSTTPTLYDVRLSPQGLRLSIYALGDVVIGNGSLDVPFDLGSLAFGGVCVLLKVQRDCTSSGYPHVICISQVLEDTRYVLWFGIVTFPRF